MIYNSWKRKLKNIFKSDGREYIWWDLFFIWMLTLTEGNVA